jgi:centromere DNA-binding complex CBF3 subunit-like protein
MILTITNGKILEAGNTDYTGILPHKDPVLCPLASLAFCLLQQFGIDHEPTPVTGLQPQKLLVPELTNPREIGGG